MPDKDVLKTALVVLAVIAAVLYVDQNYYRFPRLTA